MNDDEPDDGQEFDFFDAIAELDDRPKAVVRQPLPDSSTGPNFNPSIDDPRTRGAVKAAFKHSFDNIVGARGRGRGRNDMLNEEAFNLGQLVANGLVTEEEVRSHLTAAANASGLDIDANCGPSGIAATITSGLTNGIASGPRTNLPKMAPQGVQPPRGRTRPDRIPVSGPGDDGEPVPESKPVQDSTRRLTLRSFNDLPERRPTWAWTYGGKGRIQLGTVSIFGGPPGTGKSTAARWFVGEATRGELQGCWEGEPINVAYVAIEEDLDAMVKPSLRAAGADMSRVFYPEIIMNDAEKILASQADELALTEQLIDNDIRMLVVDPIMATLGTGIDIHRNNEVRAAIQPFVNMAQKMHGLVIGIAHYRKSGATSGVAALTGSSAFGEVARSVFGFMKGGMDADEPRVMSQSKNSAGAEDLALQYALDLTPITYPDGVSADMTKFRIIGDSDVTVEDLMAEGGTQHTKVGDAKDWLNDYLLMNGATDSKTVKRDGKADADFGDDTLYRAAKKLKVIFRNVSLAGKPRVTVWELPKTAMEAAAEEPDWMDQLDD